MSVSPSGRSDGGGVITGGEYLRLLLPEHICRIHCNQAHYVPVSVVIEASRVMGGQAVVVSGNLGLGRDADNSSGGRTGGETDGTATDTDK